MKWRACSRGKTYDTGDCLVVYFDPASGSTYLINEVADWLLAELVNKPLKTEELIALFMSQSDDISDSEAKIVVEAQIRELQTFDLIEAF